MLCSTVISGREMRVTQMLSVMAQDMNVCRARRVANTESHHDMLPLILSSADGALVVRNDREDFKF